MIYFKKWVEKSFVKNLLKNQENTVGYGIIRMFAVKNKGTNSIKGIFLDLSKIRGIYLDSKVFADLYNLRYIKFYMPSGFDESYMSSKVHLPQGLDYLHNELRYLHWHGYPLRTLPRNFIPVNIVKEHCQYFSRSVDFSAGI
ncbi:Disease resistance protein (TIR-NBS-LRR class) family [Melia azedarach]|uniref:Disease resistance protein (TIR-NBS-LRR class) family n=1 Tax=Melia azedarach TaxID=155640 RepID=A0ACC1YM93_MELAZ|nr:Disease resistance protein (TIR-NBS-LRR class) family [Melia azedarach]